MKTPFSPASTAKSLSAHFSTSTVLLFPILTPTERPGPFSFSRSLLFITYTYLHLYIFTVLSPLLLPPSCTAVHPYFLFLVLTHCHCYLIVFSLSLLIVTAIPYSSPFLLIVILTQLHSPYCLLLALIVISSSLTTQ